MKKRASSKKSEQEPRVEYPANDDYINIKVDPRETLKWKLELRETAKAQYSSEAALFFYGHFIEDAKAGLAALSQMDKAALRAQIVENRDNQWRYYKTTWEEEDKTSIFFGHIDGAVVYERGTQGGGDYVFDHRFSEVAFWQRLETTERRWSSWKRGPCFIPAPDDEWEKPETGEHILVRDLINDDYEYSGVYDALLDAIVNKDDYSVVRERSKWVSWKGEDGKLHNGPKVEEYMERVTANLIRLTNQSNLERCSDFLRPYHDELKEAGNNDGRRSAIAKKYLMKADKLHFETYKSEDGEKYLRWIRDELTEEIETSRASILEAAQGMTSVTIPATNSEQLPSLFQSPGVWTNTPEQEQRLISLLEKNGFLRRDTLYFVWLKKRTDLAFLVQELKGKAIHSEAEYLEILHCIRFERKSVILELTTRLADNFGGQCRKINNPKEDTKPSSEIRQVMSEFLTVPPSSKNEPLSS